MSDPELVPIFMIEVEKRIRAGLGISDTGALWRN